MAWGEGETEVWIGMGGSLESGGLSNRLVFIILKDILFFVNMIRP
jgi:hypothetical protein